MQPIHFLFCHVKNVSIFPLIFSVSHEFYLYVPICAIYLYINEVTLLVIEVKVCKGHLSSLVICSFVTYIYIVFTWFVCQKPEFIMTREWISFFICLMDICFYSNVKNGGK